MNLRNNTYQIINNMIKKGTSLKEIQSKNNKINRQYSVCTQDIDHDKLIYVLSVKSACCKVQTFKFDIFFRFFFFS